MVVVGLLTVEVALGEGSSLKDKRSVVRGMLDGIRHRFNVTAAEVGRQDSHRAAELAFAVVSADRRFASMVLDKVLQSVESDPRVEVVETSLEFL